MTASHDIAIVTASHAADFERCKLLCETIDRHVSGYTRHLILVAGNDVALFRGLEGPNREIVDERDILPSWLHDLPDPFSFFRRHIWLSTRTAPLRGWHVQQLRRIAIAGHAGETALLYCDSDVAFLKPFDCVRLFHGSDLRLFRRDFQLSAPGYEEQIRWSNAAGRVLGLGADVAPEHDYIGTVIAWKSQMVRAMCAHIEAQNDAHWVAAIGRSRQFSECMIYGRYVDDLCGGEGHFHDATDFCRVYWSGPRMGESEIRRFAQSLAPGQVAVGLQSFIGMDVGQIRSILAGV